MSDLESDINELKLAITDKHLNTRAGVSTYSEKKTIDEIVQKLSADDLLSGPYVKSPLRSAIVFDDQDTVKLLLGKEGLRADHIIGAHHEDVPLNTAANAVTDAMDECMDLPGNVEKQEIVREVWRKLSPLLRETDPELRAKYKSAIQSSLGVQVVGDEIGNMAPTEPLTHARQEVPPKSFGPDSALER